MTKISHYASVHPQTEMRAGATTWRAQLMRAGCGCAAGIVLVVAIVAGSLPIIMRVITPPGDAELGPHVDEYISDTGLTDVSDLTDPYRVGKLVAVDPGTRQLDLRLQKALPAELRAAQPDEVGTIVWVSWGESRVGTYKDVGSNRERGGAYQGSCEITVIDRAAGQIVERRTFEAPPPPSTTTGLGDVHTQVDVNDIVRFLADLPNELPHAPTPNTAPALVPGSKVTVKLTGPDSGIYSRTEAPVCTRHDGNPLDEWEVDDVGTPWDDRSLGDLSFRGRLGDSPVDVESATTDLVTTVRIGPIVSGRTYVVSTIEGGDGTFSIDDRGVSATITFAGKTASGVFMAWTVECLSIHTGTNALTATPPANQPQPFELKLGLKAPEENVTAPNTHMEIQSARFDSAEDVVALMIMIEVDKGSYSNISKPDKVYVVVAGRSFSASHLDGFPSENVNAVLKLGGKGSTVLGRVEFEGILDKITSARCFEFHYGKLYNFKKVCIQQ